MAYITRDLVHDALSFTEIAFSYYKISSPDRKYTRRQAQKKFLGDVHVNKEILIRVVDQICKEQKEQINSFFLTNKQKLKSPEGGVNKALMKGLKSRGIDISPKAPILNLSIKSMRGEIWKYVPGYEKHYQVSQFGRVKTVERIDERGEGKDYFKCWVPEKILRPIIFDHPKDKPVRTPTIVLRKNGIAKSYPISQLVYCLFVKKINLESKSIKIIFKDNNRLNLNARNLVRIEKTKK
jgi:hypothetical protein